MVEKPKKAKIVVCRVDVPYDVVHHRRQELSRGSVDLITESQTGLSLQADQLVKATDLVSCIGRAGIIHCLTSMDHRSLSRTWIYSAVLQHP